MQYGYAILPSDNCIIPKICGYDEALKAIEPEIDHEDYSSELLIGLCGVAGLALVVLIISVILYISTSKLALSRILYILLFFFL